MAEPDSHHDIGCRDHRPAQTESLTLAEPGLLEKGTDIGDDEPEIPPQLGENVLDLDRTDLPPVVSTGQTAEDAEPPDRLQGSALGRLPDAEQHRWRCAGWAERRRAETLGDGRCDLIDVDEDGRSRPGEPLAIAPPLRSTRSRLVGPRLQSAGLRRTRIQGGGRLVDSLPRGESNKRAYRDDEFLGAGCRLDDLVDPASRSRSLPS